MFEDVERSRMSLEDIHFIAYIEERKVQNNIHTYKQLATVCLLIYDEEVVIERIERQVVTTKSFQFAAFSLSLAFFSSRIFFQTGT